MNTTTRIAPAIEACSPALIEFEAEAGTDDALLDHGELRRQRAGAQQDREVVRGSRR